MLTTGSGLAFALSVLAVMALIWLIILWIVLPFMLKGIKPLIREAIHRQDATNKLLQTLVDQGQRAASPATEAERLQGPPS